MFHRILGVCLLGLCMAALWGGVAMAEEMLSEADLAQARAWMEQLGDDDFQAREDAAEYLCDYGPAVVPVLEEGLAFDDIEVRCRCERLLSEIYVIERERRIESFIAGTQPENEEVLPCWNRIQQALGNNQDVRELYVLMLRSEWELLEQVEQDSPVGYQKMRERCVEIQLTYRVYQQEIPLGSMTTLLFLAADDEQCPQPVNSILYNLCFQNPFARDVTGNGERVEVLRRLLGHWIEQRNNLSNPYESLMLSMRYELPEGITPARDILTDDTLAVGVKQMAMVAIAKLGNEDDLSVLEPYLENDQLCQVMQTGEDRIESQVRDTALATQIYLCGLEPADFGFRHLSASGYMLFAPATAGFASNEERDEAFAAWNAYLEEHPISSDGE